MKKLFIIILSILVNLSVFSAEKSQKSAAATVHEDLVGSVSTLYNDSKEAVTTIYSDGKTLLGEAYPEVKAALVMIAKSLGIAVEHVYMVLVKKYVVEGVAEAMFFVPGVLLVIIGLIRLRKYMVNNQPIKWGVLYPIGLLIVGFIFLGLVDYNKMLMGLINPEYGAINYILEYSKQMIK